MSKELDQRVVEMQFDNKEFERNVSTSLGTIEKLKMALNFDGAKGLDSITEAARRMDLSNVERQTDSVRVQFSSLQIAGATMIANLTTSFMNFGKKLWSISFGQMKSGGMGRALKIEQANFKMKALAKNIDAVKNGLITVDDLLATMSDSIDRAVTGTAYGYDSAANVASQLMASGLTDANKMYDYLRAIAGAAAMTGRSFDDIGNIFTTVASNGKFMTMQLRQFSASGLNVAATLANTTKFAGKTEAAITEMISKGKIGFEDFADAMNEAFGEAAGKADETYAGVLSNVKAQLSRLGQRFAVPYIENMIPFLQKLKAAIKQVSATLAPVSERFDKYFGMLTRWGSSVLENFDYTRISIGFRSIENLAWLVIGVLKTLGDAFKEVFVGKTQDEIVEAARQFEKFTEQLLPSKEAIDGLRGIFVALLTPLKIVLKYAGKLTTYTRPIIVAISKIAQAVLSIFSVLEPLALWLLNVIDQMGVFDAVLTLVTNTIVYLATVVAILIAVLGELFKQLVTSERFKSFGKAIEQIAVNLSTLLVTALIKVFELIFNIFDFIAKATSDSSFFTVLIDNIIVLVNWVGELAKAFQFWLNTPGSAEGLKNVVKFVEHFISMVTDFFTGQDITKDIDGMGNSLHNLGEVIREMGQRFKDSWNNIDKSKTIMFLFVLTMIVVLLSIKNFIDSLTNLSKSVASIPKTITEFSKTLKHMNDMFGPVAQTIIAFGATISILTAAIKTLSAIPADDLKRGTIALAAMTAVVATFVAVFIYLEKVINPANMVVVNNAAIDLVAVAASMLLMVSAIKKIADISGDTNKLLASAGTLVVLMGALSGVVIGFSKFATIVSKPDLKVATSVSALSMLAFAASMLILVQALKMLEQADMPNIKENLKNLGVLMLELAVGMKVAAGATWGSAASIVAFLGSLITVFGLLALLALVPMDLVKSTIEKATIIFSSFASMLLILSVAGKIAMGSERVVMAMSGLILSFVSVISTFILLTLVIDNLKNPKSIEKALNAMERVITDMAVAVGSLVVIYGIFVGVSKMLAGWKKKAYLSAVSSAEALVSMGELLLMMAGSMVLIGVAGALLSKVPADVLKQLEVYLVTMGVIAGAVTAIGRNAKGSMNKNSFGLIVSMLLSLTLIIGALAVFQYADMEKLVISATALTYVILAIAVLIGAVSLISKNSNDKDKDTKKAQTSIWSISAFVLALAGLAYVITSGSSGMASAGVSTEFMIAFGMTMIGLLATLGLLIAGLSKIEPSDYKKAYIGIGAITLLLVPIGTMMAGLAILSGYIDNSNVDALLKTTGAMLGAITALTVILAAISSVKKVNTKKIFRISSSIALLSTVFLAISASLSALAITKAGWKEFGIAVASLGIAVAALSILGALTAKNKLYTEDLMAIAGSFAILGTVFLETSAAMAIIKQSGAGWNEYGQLALMILELGAILGALDVVSRMGGITSTGARIMAMGATITIAAQSMITIASAMAILKKVGATGDDMISLGLGFSVLCGALTAFAAISGYFPIVSAGLIALAEALLGFGVASLGISAVINSIVTAFVVLSSISHENIDTFVDNLEYLSDRIAEIGMSIVKIIQTLSTTIAAVVGQAIAFTVVTMIGTLAEFLPAILQALYSVLVVLVDFFGQPEVQDLLNEFSKVVGETITNIVIGAVDGMFWTIAQRTAELFGITRDDFAQLKEDLQAIADGTYASEEDYINHQQIAVRQKQMEELQNAAEYVKDAKKAMENGQDIDQEKVKQYIEYIKYLSDELENAGVMSERIVDWEAEDGLGAMMGLRHVSTQKYDFATEADDILRDAQMLNINNYDEWASAINENIDDVEYNYQTFRDEVGSSQLYEELFPNASETENAVDAFVDAQDRALAHHSSGSKHFGEEYTENYVDGLTNDYSVEIVEEGTEELITRQSDMMTDAGIHTGTLTANSMADGMTSAESQGYIITAATANSDLAYATAQDNLNAKEPVTLSVDSENTDNLNTSLDETEDSATAAKDGLAEADAQLTDFSNTAVDTTAIVNKLGNSLSWLGDAAAAYGIDISKLPKLGSFLGISEDVYMSADEWRKKGMEKTWGTMAGGELSRYEWERTGKYKTLDDYVNQNAHAGEEWGADVLGLNAIKEQSEEVQNELSETLDNVTNGLGGVGDAAGAATKKTDELKDSIKSSLDVFSAFNDKVSTTGRDVLKNFASQIKGVTKWSEELQALSARGINANFLSELAEQGPEAYEKIHALYTMTDSELSLFNQMYAQKLSLQKNTVKDIRNSFVKNGAMTAKEAKEYGKTITTAAASGVKDSTDKLTKSETKALQDAAEEARRQKIDDNIIQKYTVETSYSKETLDIFNRLEELQRGGNVNLLMRPTIDTNELNKLGWDAGEGFATMFTSTFTNEEEGTAINFTPIMVDPKTGKYLGVLDPDTFDKYCQDVVEGVRKDDLNLQVGAEFTGADAFEQASAAAQEIHELHEQLGEDWGKDGFASLQKFGENLDDAVKSDFISKFAKSVISNDVKLSMTQAFTDLGLVTMKAFTQSMNFETAVDKLIEFKNGVKEQVRNVLNLFEEVKVKTDKQKKDEQITTSQMLYNMTENAKKVGRWATNIQRLTERGLSEGLVDQLRKLGPEGADQIDAFVRMSDKELKKANAIYSSSLQLDEYTSDKLVSAYSKAGFATALGLKKGLDDGKDDLLFAYQETGEDASAGFVKGIDPEAAMQVMTFLGTNSLSALKTALDSHSPSEETKKIGMDTTEGYVLGIAKPNNLVDAMSHLAITTLDLFTQLLGPDKFRQMGYDCTDAFSRGILDGLDAKSRDILTMFTLKMMGINDNLAEPENSMKVNIVPVVDQNALYNSSTLMNDFLSNRNFDISATVNRANATNRTTGGTDQSLIVDAIRGLRDEIKNIRTVNEGYRSDIGSLRDAISSMKVTLDTGALVGQITNPLDAALGTKAMRSLRRRG